MLERLIAYVIVIGTILWVASELATPDEVVQEKEGPPDAAEEPAPAPSPRAPEKPEKEGLLDLPLL